MRSTSFVLDWAASLFAKAKEKDKITNCNKKRLLYNFLMFKNKTEFFRNRITSIIVVLTVFIVWALDQNYSYAEENWVEVEQSPIVVEEKGKKKKVKFLSHRERRQSWSFRFTLLGVKSELVDYTRSSTQILSSLKSAGAGFEGMVSISYNLGFFSTGFDFGLMRGSYDKGINEVSAFMPKAAVHIIADNMFETPYFAPYVKIGASQISFTNPKASDIPELKGSVSPFYAFGGMFNLDWFQKSLAMDAYFGYGLNATYFVIEYENFPGISLNVDGFPEVKQNALKFGLQLVF